MSIYCEYISIQILMVLFVLIIELLTANVKSGYLKPLFKIFVTFINLFLQLRTDYIQTVFTDIISFKPINNVCHSFRAPINF